MAVRQATPKDRLDDLHRLARDYSEVMASGAKWLSLRSSLAQNLAALAVEIALTEPETDPYSGKDVPVERRTDATD